MAVLTDPTDQGSRGSHRYAGDMHRTIRPLLVASLVLGMFCLLLGDWLVAGAMALNAVAMARIARRHKL